MPATYAPSGFAVDAMLCDSAASVEGKVYIQGGGWNMLQSQTFPFVQDRIGLAAIVSVPYNKTNENHQLEVWLETEDGDRLPLGAVQDAEGNRTGMSAVGARFNIGRPPILQAGDAQNLPFAINLGNIQFNSPGVYSFVISVDGTEMERLTFRVIPLNPMPVARG